MKIFQKLKISYKVSLQYLQSFCFLKDIISLYSTDKNHNGEKFLTYHILTSLNLLLSQIIFCPN